MSHSRYLPIDLSRDMSLNRLDGVGVEGVDSVVLVESRNWPIGCMWQYILVYSNQFIISMN